VEEKRNTKTAIGLPLFFGLAMALGIIIGANFTRPKLQTGEAILKNTLKLREILFYIDKEYVDSVNTGELVEKAIGGMLEKLDPHSAYLPIKSAVIANQDLQGEFDGIGVEFNVIRDTVTIMAVLPGGPSERAGLLPGDKIIQVEGERIAGVKASSQTIVSTLRGPRGSAAKVDIKRKGQKELIEVSIIRDKIPQFSLATHYMVDHETGYIKINSFSATTHDEFKKALSDLKNRGMRKLLIDLQGNPGGYVSTAVGVADELLGKNAEIVRQVGKEDKYFQNTKAIRPGLFETGPVVILVDESTASAAEILAGALQDNDRALIVGRRTYGKGLVQRPIKLEDGSELRLTIARYYTPSGRSIQRPYDNGREDYRQESMRRLQNGAYFHADSTGMDTLKTYQTVTGRKVYGGGGIMPDRFVALDTSSNSAYLSRLVSSQAIKEVAMDFVAENRARLEKMGFEEFERSFNINSPIFAKMISHAQSVGIPYDQAGFEKSKTTIGIYLKAFIARGIWSDSGFFPILNKTDEIYLHALTLFTEAEILAQR
jgi:carboxyl-terminal processing protease